jgi:hypothetical protein
MTEVVATHSSVRGVQLALLSALGVLGCGSSSGKHTTDAGKVDAGAAVNEQGRKDCCRLGKMCHMLGEMKGGEYGTCHEIGHTGEPTACIANYERCTKLCIAGGADPTPPPECDNPDTDAGNEESADGGHSHDAGSQ